MRKRHTIPKSPQNHSYYEDEADLKKSICGSIKITLLKSGSSCTIRRGLQILLFTTVIVCVTIVCYRQILTGVSALQSSVEFSSSGLTLHNDRRKPSVALKEWKNVMGFKKIDGIDVFVEMLNDAEARIIQVEQVLDIGKTDYLDYVVFEDFDKNRILVLDGALQFSSSKEYGYHELMAHIPLVNAPHNCSVLILGAGDGGVTREVTHWNKVKNIVQIDLDQGVKAISEKWFPEVAKGFDDPRVTLLYGDAKKFLVENTEKFDVIIMDFTDDPRGDDGMAHFDPLDDDVTERVNQMFFDKEFYTSMFDALNPQGIFLRNQDSMLDPEEDPSKTKWENDFNFLKKNLPEIHNSIRYVPVRLDNPEYLFYGGLMIFKDATMDPMSVDWMHFYAEKIETKWFNQEMYRYAILNAPGHDIHHSTGPRLTMNYNVRVYECKNDITILDEWFLAVENTAREMQLTELARSSHVFPNGGLSLNLLLSESHIAVHTWPEHKTAVIDIRTCKFLKGKSTPFGNLLAEPFECKWQLESFLL